MKASFHLLISSLLSLASATAGSCAQAGLLRADSGSAERDRINAALQRPEIRARAATPALVGIRQSAQVTHA